MSDQNKPSLPRLLQDEDRSPGEITPEDTEAIKKILTPAPGEKMKILSPDEVFQLYDYRQKLIAKKKSRKGGRR